MRVPRVRALWLAIPLLVGMIGWGWWRGVAVERETRRERDELLARRAQLQRAIWTLETDVTALKHEREARARAARETLDVVAPGEVLVIVAQPTPARGAK